MAKDLVDTIHENAQGPVEVTGETGSMRQHSLREQIEADRYLRSKQATQSRGIGARISKLVPPGAE